MTLQKTIHLAWTGASGARYGLRLLHCLLAAPCRVWLTITPAARLVIKQELALTLPAQPAATRRMLATHCQADPALLSVFGDLDWNAPPASGSHPADAMVICPCSMGTLGKVAVGLADSLTTRAADVMLKERRPLILVPRETPLSTLHLENMLRLSRAGAVILPPNPGFYFQPQSVDALVDFVVARLLDHLAVPHTLVPRWGDAAQNPPV